MTRIFTDTLDNEIPDIEYRIGLPGLILALLENGTLDAAAVETATAGRIIDRTAEYAAAREIQRLAEEAVIAAEKEAVKNKTPEVRAAGNEFSADPAADFEATRNKAPDAE